jgi:hypothetical protein
MHVGAAPTFFVDIANPFFGQHPVFFSAGASIWYASV